MMPSCGIWATGDHTNLLQGHKGTYVNLGEQRKNTIVVYREFKKTFYFKGEGYTPICTPVIEGLHNKTNQLVGFRYILVSAKGYAHSSLQVGRI